MDALLDQLTHLPPAGLYAALALFAALENIFPPIPADTAVALGAFLAARQDLSLLTIYSVTLAGNLVSLYGVYYAAGHYGRRFMTSRIGRRLVAPATLDRIGRLYERYHLLGLFVSRFLPVYRAVVPPFAAIAGLPARKAMPPVMVATAIYYAVLVTVAHQLGANWEAVRDWVAHLGVALLAAAGVATVVLVVLWRRFRRARRDD